MLGLGIGSFVETADFASKRGVAFSNTKSYDGDVSNSNGVDTQYDPQTLLRSSHSWSMWLKPDDGRPSGAYTLFGLHNNSDTTELYYALLNNDGTLLLVHYAGNGTVGALALASSEVIFADGAQSDFTHIAIVADYSGSNVEYTFYADGSALTTTYAANLKVTVANAGGYLSFGNSLSIDGRKSAGSSNLLGGYDGLIDEFGAFTKALSSSEVTAIRNGGTPTDLTGHDGLELYYRFEDDLTDTAGTSDGVAIGSVTFSSTTP